MYYVFITIKVYIQLHTTLLFQLQSAFTLVSLPQKPSLLIMLQMHPMVTSTIDIRSLHNIIVILNWVLECGLKAPWGWVGH